MATPASVPRRARVVERPGPALAAVLLWPLARVLGAAVAVWQRPILLAVGAAWLICLRPRVPSEPGSISPADMGAVVFIGAALYRLARDSSMRRFPPGALLGPLAIVSAGLLTTLTAADQTASLTGTVRFAEVFVLLPICVMATLKSRS